MAKKQQIKTAAAPQNSSAPIEKSGPFNPAIIQALCIVVLVVFSWLLYQPALKNGFTNWDDNVYVTDNKYIAWTAENRAALATEEIAGNFHPLTMWSLQWDYKKTGGKIDPVPYHRTNILLHLLNGALMFFFIFRLSGNTFAAFLTALFFSIHPMHVESVAWVSGRKDVLFSAFFLLGLLSYLKAGDKRGTGAQLPWMGATFAFFLLSCLSKPAAIVFPAILWLIDWYKQPQDAWSVKRLLPNLPFWVASALFSFLTLKYQKHVGAVDEHYFSMLEKSLFAAYSVVLYLFKLVFPLNLSAFHPVPDNKSDIGANYYLAALAALGVVAYTAYTYVKGKREQFFGLAFFFIQLVLVLGFIRVGSAVYAERYTYLAYTGIFMALGLAAHRLIQGSAAQKLAIGAALGLFTVFFAWKTREQIGVWKNSETLWTQIIAQYPTEKTLSYRGYHHYLNNQFDKALADFDQVYAKNQNNETTLHIRGLCLQKVGKIEEALAMFDAYDKQFPPKAEVKFAAAECLMGLKRTEEAANRFAQALEMDASNVAGWVNASTLWFSLNNHAKAEEYLTKALSLQPDHQVALNNRGACRMVMGKYADALEDFNKSLQKDPNQQQIREYQKRCLEKSPPKNQ